MGPSWAQAVVWPTCFFQKGPRSPEESRMLSPFLPDLNAAGRAETVTVLAPEAELGQVWKEP